MSLYEARSFVGQCCLIRWQDRNGKECELSSKIYDAVYVPLYGGYLITDTDELPLDRITHICLIDQQPAEEAATSAPLARAA